MKIKVILVKLSLIIYLIGLIMGIILGYGLSETEQNCPEGSYTICYDVPQMYYSPSKNIVTKKPVFEDSYPIIDKENVEKI